MGWCMVQHTWGASDPPSHSHATHPNAPHLKNPWKCPVFMPEDPHACPLATSTAPIPGMQPLGMYQPPPVRSQHPEDQQDRVQAVPQQPWCLLRASFTQITPGDSDKGSLHGAGINPQGNMLHPGITSSSGTTSSFPFSPGQPGRSTAPLPHAEAALPVLAANTAGRLKSPPKNGIFSAKCR